MRSLCAHDKPQRARKKNRKWNKGKVPPKVFASQNSTFLFWNLSFPSKILFSSLFYKEVFL
jgi:hypothetical protein